MESLAGNPVELRIRGFKALADALGWANAVLFLRQFEPGIGNYTEERETILPDWDPARLVKEATAKTQP